MNKDEAKTQLGRILVEIEDAKDPIALIIRVLIIFDGLLGAMLQFHCHLPRMDRFLDSNRLFFAAKCDLARAIGLLSASEHQFFLAFNRLRNKVAHHAEMRVSATEVSELAKVLEGYGWAKPAYNAAPDTTAWMECLRHLALIGFGILIENGIAANKSGRTPVIATELSRERWKRLDNLGVIVSVRATQSERIKVAAEKLESRPELKGASAEEIREALDRELGPLNRTIGKLSINWRASVGDVEGSVD